VPSAAAVCFVSLPTADRSVALCFCPHDSPATRQVLTPAEYDHAAELPSTTVVAWEVAGGRWTRLSVDIDLPSAPPHRPAAPCVLPWPADRLAVAGSFDYCAVAHAADVHVWRVQLTTKSESRISLVRCASRSLPAPDPPGDGGGDRHFLLTSMFLAVGAGRGELAFCPLVHEAEGKGGWQRVRFTDPAAGTDVTDLKALDGNRVVLLTAGGAVHLVGLYHPFQPNRCLLLAIPQRVKAFDTFAFFLRLLSGGGPPALCYADAKGTAHIADLRPALDRLDRQVLRKCGADNEDSASLCTIRPVQSLFVPEHCSAITTLHPNILLMATHHTFEALVLHNPSI